MKTLWLTGAIATLALSRTSAEFAGSNALSQLAVSAADRGLETPQPPEPVRPQPVAQDPDEVLATLEGEDSVMFWFARDQKLAARAVQEGFPKFKDSTRDAAELLKKIQSGWMVLRDPAEDKPHYAFLDAKTGKVYYVDVAASADFRDAKLDRTGLAVVNDRLTAVYGGPKAGHAMRHRYVPDAQDTSRVADLRDYADEKLASAALFDPDSMADLLQEGAVSAAAETLNRPGADSKPSVLSRMAGFLAEKPDRAVHLTVQAGGALLFKLAEEGRDRVYIHVKGPVIRELPLR